MHATKEFISPARAREMLDRTKRLGFENRKPNLNHVERLSRELRTGAWRLNGESIILDPDGAVLDGQHRLLAILNTGIGAESLVVSGIPREHFPSIDGLQQKRAAAHVLGMRGERNRTVLAAAIRWYHRLQNSQLCTRNFPITNAETLDILSEHPGLRDSVDRCVGLRHVTRAVPIMAFCHYVFSRINHHEADYFFEMLGSRENGVVRPQAVHLLHEKLMNHRAKIRQFTTEEIVYLVFRAWGAFRHAENLTKLQLPKGGLTNSNMIYPD